MTFIEMANNYLSETKLGWKQADMFSSQDIFDVDEKRIIDALKSNIRKVEMDTGEEGLRERVKKVLIDWYNKKDKKIPEEDILNVMIDEILAK